MDLPQSVKIDWAGLGLATTRTPIRFRYRLDFIRSDDDGFGCKSIRRVLHPRVLNLQRRCGRETEVAVGVVVDRNKKS
jgi:hypothetical protein